MLISKKYLLLLLFFSFFSFLFFAFFFFLLFSLPVYTAFSNGGKRFIGLFFFFQRLRQQLGHILFAHGFCQGHQRTVGGDLIVLYFLCRRNNTGIACHGAFFSFFQDAFTFFYQSFHGFTFFCLGFFTHHLKSFFNTGHMF